MIAAAILAGGRATRMGGVGVGVGVGLGAGVSVGASVNKALLEVGGLTIVDRQVRLLRQLCGELWLVGEDDPGYAGLGLRVIGDAAGPEGPLRGIAAVLAATTAPAVLVVGCDMPWLSEAALRLLVESMVGVDAVAPRVDGQPEPLHALYSRAPCAAAAGELLAAGQGGARALLERVNTRWLERDVLAAIDPELRFLTNVNTREQLAAADMMRP